MTQLSEREGLVPSVCVRCRKPVRVWGNYYYGKPDKNGNPPVARMWGGFYQHDTDDQGRCRS